jgi:hypothetical protein
MNAAPVPIQHTLQDKNMQSCVDASLHDLQQLCAPIPMVLCTHSVCKQPMEI